MSLTENPASVGETFGTFVNDGTKLGSPAVIKFIEVGSSESRLWNVAVKFVLVYQGQGISRGLETK